MKFKLFATVLFFTTFSCLGMNSDEAFENENKIIFNKFTSEKKYKVFIENSYLPRTKGPAKNDVYIIPGKSAKVDHSVFYQYWSRNKKFKVIDTKYEIGDLISNEMHHDVMWDERDVYKDRLTDGSARAFRSITVYELKPEGTSIEDSDNK